MPCYDALLIKVRPVLPPAEAPSAYLGRAEAWFRRTGAHVLQPSVMPRWRDGKQVATRRTRARSGARELRGSRSQRAFFAGRRVLLSTSSLIWQMPRSPWHLS